MISEKEYRSEKYKDHLNQSLLQTLIEPGWRERIIYNEMHKQPQRYSWQLGHAFEACVMDEGLETDDYFKSRFFVSQFNPTAWDKGSAAILLNTILEGDELPDFERKQDGEPISVKKSTLNKLLPECMENEGKIPIGQKTFAKMKKMAKNMMGVIITFGNNVATLREIIQHEDTEYQCGIVWEQEVSGRIRHMKGLLDIVLIHDNIIVPIDIKLSAIIGKHEQRLKRSGWIQGQHYCSGLKANYPDTMVYPMQYVVGYDNGETAPCLVRCESIEEETYALDTERYQDLLHEYFFWLDAGRPVSGILPSIEYKFWRKNYAN
jgi:hypothetical protein